MTVPEPSAAAFGEDTPSSARIYDYFLGGAHNFAADRALADQIAQAYPDAPRSARAQRAFIMRAVRFCVDQGVRQFLDLGSGIPTSDHVHETARAIAPDTRVAYVDIEPIAVAFSSQLLADVPGVTITAADVRDPDTVLTAPTVTGVLDFSAPIGLIAVGIVQFIPDADDPEAIMARYRAALAPGSYLALSHGSHDLEDPTLGAQIADAVAIYDHSATPQRARSRERIHGFFGDLPLVEPGLVDPDHWRHQPTDPISRGQYAAVARVP